MALKRASLGAFLLVTADSEATTTDETLTVGTPSSEEPQAIVSEETTPPPVQGEETPAPEEPPAAKPLESWSLEELDTKAFSEGLTPDETRRRDQLYAAKVQSENDRRQHEAEQLAILQERQRQEQATIAKSRETLDATLTRINDLEAMHGGAPELYEAQRKAALDEYQEQIGAVKLAPHLAGVRGAVLRLVGDTVQNRNAVNAKDLPELVSDLYSLAYDAGRKAGVPEGYEAKKVADWEKEKRAAVSSALDEFKAKHPHLAPPSTESVTGIPAGGYTLAQIDAMPTNQWLALGDHATRQQILADARAREMRGG